MSMYQPGALQNFLKGLGVAPKKGLSQNFLIDGNILRKIVSIADVDPGDVILEIGPGPGALTEALLNKGAKVVAIEKDAVMAGALERLQTQDGRLETHCMDVLEADLEGVLAPHLGKTRKAKVIANLPYHITTPILTQILPMRHFFEMVVVMVQEEVARRFAAKPSSPDFSSITVYANFYADVSYGFKVSRNCFLPAPKVDSAIVKFMLKEPPLLKAEDVESFFKLTRTAFGQRRKMLKSSLKEHYPSQNLAEVLEGLKLNPLARPENLSLEDFLILWKAIN